VIDADAEVIVVGGDLQGLIVRPAGSVRRVEDLPDFGRVVHASFVDVVARQEQLDEACREEWRAQLPAWRAARRAYGWRMGLPLGAAFAVAGLWFAQAELDRAGDDWRIVALTVVLSGMFWAVVVFRAVDWLQQYALGGSLPRLDEGAYDRLTLLSTGLGLLGATVTAVLVVPGWGVAAGAAAAVAATVALAAIVPVLLIANATADDGPDATAPPSDPEVL
jgi:hypothetical protein